MFYAGGMKHCGELFLQNCYCNGMTVAERRFCVSKKVTFTEIFLCLREIIFFVRSSEQLIQILSEVPVEYRSLFCCLFEFYVNLQLFKYENLREMLQSLSIK